MIYVSHFLYVISYAFAIFSYLCTQINPFHGIEVDRFQIYCVHKHRGFEL